MAEKNCRFTSFRVRGIGDPHRLHCRMETAPYGSLRPPSRSLPTHQRPSRQTPRRPPPRQLEGRSNRHPKRPYLIRQNHKSVPDPSSLYRTVTQHACQTAPVVTPVSQSQWCRHSTRSLKNSCRESGKSSISVILCVVAAVLLYARTQDTRSSLTSPV